MAAYYSFIPDTPGRRVAAAAYLRNETLHRFLFVSGAFAVMSLSLFAISMNRDILPDQAAAAGAILFVSRMLGFLYAAEVIRSMASSYRLGEGDFLRSQLMRRPWVMAYTDGCYLTLNLNALEEYVSTHGRMEMRRRARASRKRLRERFSNETGRLAEDVMRWVRMHPCWPAAEVYENAVTEILKEQEGTEQHDAERILLQGFPRFRAKGTPSDI